MGEVMMTSLPAPGREEKGPAIVETGGPNNHLK
jgi:hypothetical protein